MIAMVVLSTRGGAGRLLTIGALCAGAVALLAQFVRHFADPLMRSLPGRRGGWSSGGARS